MATKGNPGNTKKTGRLGELLTMYILEEADIECYLVDRTGVDLICMSPRGQLFTVQVKASNLQKYKDRNYNRKPTYVFNVKGPKISDYYIFLALDIQRIVVMRGEDIDVTSTKKLTHEKFTHKAHMEGLNTLSTTEHAIKKGSHPQA